MCDENNINYYSSHNKSVLAKNKGAKKWKCLEYKWDFLITEMIHKIGHWPRLGHWHWKYGDGGQLTDKKC